MDRVDLSFLQFQILLEYGNTFERVRNISLLSEHYIQNYSPKDIYPSAKIIS